MLHIFHFWFVCFSKPMYKYYFTKLCFIFASVFIFFILILHFLQNAKVFWKISIWKLNKKSFNECFLKLKLNNWMFTQLILVYNCICFVVWMMLHVGKLIGVSFKQKVFVRKLHFVMEENYKNQGDKKSSLWHFDFNLNLTFKA